MGVRDAAAAKLVLDVGIDHRLPKGVPLMQDGERRTPESNNTRVNTRRMARRWCQPETVGAGRLGDGRADIVGFGNDGVWISRS
jgi:hypothetical protein